MRSKAETLCLIVEGLLKPLANADFPPVPDNRPREGDALWQVGHAAFDTARALVSPFGDRDLEARFDEAFRGTHNASPWEGTRPNPNDVIAWWNNILSCAANTLETHRQDETLSEPIAFTAYTVHTLGEAFDYVIYHTSFHLAFAQARLGGM